MTLQFERELGFRPRLQGSLEQCLDIYFNEIGSALVAKYSFPSPDASVTTEDRVVDGVGIRIYTPPDLSPGRPIFVYAHGGGWCMGDLSTDDGNCRLIAKAAGCVLVSVDYRLAPKHPYP